MAGEKRGWVRLGRGRGALVLENGFEKISSTGGKRSLIHEASPVGDVGCGRGLADYAAGIGEWRTWFADTHGEIE